MGLVDFLLSLFGKQRQPAQRGKRRRRARQKPRLVPLRRNPAIRQAGPRREPLVETAELPYRFAHFGVVHGGFLDLSRDGHAQQLQKLGLPVFRTPEEMADWLNVRLGKLAWLVHRFSADHRPADERQAHYIFRWIRKRSGGWRLLEVPKRILKDVQRAILHEILDRIPPHPSAHGFVAGRSIVTNAGPHAGSRVVLKFDLENFYCTVGFARVTSIFRSIGYSREAAIWLARLTTSALPPNMPFPNGDASAILPFLPRHLPQGASTSPALANLSAFGLDVRLSGMARSFGSRYTRYADDLTFSGSHDFVRALPTFIPLAGQIVRAERFRVNRRKRRVLRNNQRQSVAGVVVNARPNVSRDEFDRLKATLTNCVRHGPASQNRSRIPNFAVHLRGRIAHVQQLNRNRAEKLLALYSRIDWGR